MVVWNKFIHEIITHIWANSKQGVLKECQKRDLAKLIPFPRAGGFKFADTPPPVALKLRKNIEKPQALTKSYLSS